MQFLKYSAELVPKFWIIWLWYLFFALHTRVSLWGTIKKSELWNHLSYRGLPYPFEVGRQTFRNAMIPNFQVTTSKFKIEHPLTSMASKTALPNIIKMVSNCHIFSKDWYDVYAVRGLWSWSKYFFQTCVLHGAHKWLNELISIRRTQMSLCKTELLC